MLDEFYIAPASIIKIVSSLSLVKFVLPDRGVNLRFPTPLEAEVTLISAFSQGFRSVKSLFSNLTHRDVHCT